MLGPQKENRVSDHSNEKPGDLIIPCFALGRDLYTDFGVTNPCCASNVKEIAKGQGKAACTYAEKEMAKYKAINVAFTL